MKRVYK